MATASSTPGPLPSVDLRRLPRPDYSLVDLDHYRYELLGESLRAVRGLARAARSRARSARASCRGGPCGGSDPEQLIGEVEQAVRRDGVRSAYFIDLEFHLGGDTNRALCDHLARARLPLKWCCQLRAREAKDDLLGGHGRGRAAAWCTVGSSPAPPSG